jgi:hypothetical protein
MARKKDKLLVKGGQLVAAGDLIQLMDGGSLVKCRVLSCLIADGGACHASLEIIEGERQGQRIDAKIRAGEMASDQGE